jgi:methylthioribose-1-phosphate isomerase
LCIDDDIDSLHALDYTRATGDYHTNKNKTMMTIEPIQWRNNKLSLLDQRMLPHEEVWLEYETAESTAEAITDMVVRGAPAIGVTAAYGVVLAARSAWSSGQHDWKRHIASDIECLAASRPTAVNLFWALACMQEQIALLPDDTSPESTLLAFAQQLHINDVNANKTLGDFGASLLSENSVVLTHCNAGALATAGYGTALGVIRSASAQGKIQHVYVDETRPWLQGARLTAWELIKEGIPMTLQSDVAAAALMATGQLDWIIVGADRIASNGDTANKIGTYALAVLAKYHGVKVMIAAPTSTIDWQITDGGHIPIEQRASHEVTHLAGKAVAPLDVLVSNPAFDVTPASLIDAIVTEKGIVLAPSTERMQILNKQ